MPCHARDPPLPVRLSFLRPAAGRAPSDLHQEVTWNDRTPIMGWSGRGSP